LSSEANAAVTIPSAWGKCLLTVRGEPTTTFTLYEFSDAEAD